MDTSQPDIATADDRRRALSAVLRADDFSPLSAAVTVEFGSHSAAGDLRATNDDHFVILRLSRSQDVIATSLRPADLPPRFDEHGYAMVVADGGGRAGSGALASRVALSTLVHLAIHHGRWSLRVDASTAEAIIDRTVWLYEQAGHAVDEHGASFPELGDLSTTMTAVLSAGDQLFYAHVGNSRAYLFRDGALTRLTRDHTLGERLADLQGPLALPPGSRDLRRLLTDVLGTGRTAPSVDIERFRLLDNDTILLCTDGLTEVLDDETIANVLSTGRHADDLCRRLIDLVAQSGGADDATALLARYHIPPAPDPAVQGEFRSPTDA